MRNLIRLLAVLVVAAVAAVAFPSVADAGWARAFSSIDERFDDPRLCDDTFTFEGDFLVDDGIMPADYDFVLGAPYPFTPVELEVFGTADDAVNDVNPILVVPIEIVLADIAPEGGRHQFLGENTVPTPAGYSEGDVIYVQELGAGFGLFDAFPLTIGDTYHNCPVAPTADFDAEFLFGGPEVRVRTRGEAILVFDNADDIDWRSLKVSADNSSKMAPVQDLGEIGGFRYVYVRLRRAGLNCGTDYITISGFAENGAAVSDDLPVMPVPCVWRYR